jgi:hypothetical protein
MAAPLEADGKLATSIKGKELQVPESANPSIESQSSRNIPFFRSTLFQILIVGICAFSAPGIWAAMNGTKPLDITRLYQTASSISMQLTEDGAIH